ncbi:PD-(D/E)XK nuclease family protein, partial [Devosia sp.]|uniref:PD-(D/E)XK nuclease family protein n=1 Tax=Devosia sp. TaxID=1871048 RepID=UPI002F0608E6
GPVRLPPLPAYRPVPVVRPSAAFAAADVSRALETTAEAAAVDADLARRKGIALHALLQHLARVPAADRRRVAGRALPVLLPEFPDEHPALLRKAISILDRPEFAPLFGPDSRAEVPFLAEASRDGAGIRLAGRIDRLVVGPDRVLVVDFKSDAAVPAGPETVPAAYRTQLGLYALVADQLFPGRRVAAAILWTSLESLLELPREVLADSVREFTVR